MKKFIYIFLSAIISLSLTACTPEGMPPEDESLPVVDIVERSRLLDMVNIDYVADKKLTDSLRPAGITLSMEGFEMTGDYTGIFNLNIKSAESEISLPVKCLLSYRKKTAGGKDSFSDVKLYWGGIKVFGDKLVLTNMDKAQVFSLSENGSVCAEMDLSFLNNIDGYALDVVPFRDGYLYTYRGRQQCGIAIFDSAGEMKNRVVLGDNENFVDAFVTLKNAFEISDIPLVKTDDRGLVYIASVTAPRDRTYAFLYDADNDVNYSIDNGFVDKDFISDDLRYTINYFKRDETDDGIYVAAAYNSGGIDKMLAFKEEYSLKHYAKYNGNMLNTDENGKLHFICKNMGIDLTVDFEKGTVTKQQNITEDILIDCLHTSLDRKFSLYTFGRTNYPNMTAYHIALKENASGKTKYIGFMPPENGETDISETGFFSNGEIYLLTGSDFVVFDRDMANTQPVFSMADNFPLGYNAVKEGVDRYLSAVRRNSDGSFYAVYYDYDWMDNDRYTEGNVMGQLKATYQIAHLDKNGNMLSTYDTGVNVQCGTSPVNMYLRNGRLYLSVMYKDTDQAYVKFNFDTAKHTLEITQPYTEPVISIN